MIQPVFELRHNGSRDHPFNTALDIFLFVGKKAQRCELPVELQPVARLGGNISEGDRDWGETERPAQVHAVTPRSLIWIGVCQGFAILQ